MKINVSFLDDEGNVDLVRLFSLIVLVAVVIVVAAYLYNLIVGWTTLPADKLSPQNVEAEYSWFYSQHNALKSLRASKSALEKNKQELEVQYGADQEKWPSAKKDEYRQISGQVLQLVTSYNAKCGEYQARWDNVFHSMVAPRNIPRDCGLVQ